MYCRTGGTHQSRRTAPSPSLSLSLSIANPRSLGGTLTPNSGGMKAGQDDFLRQLTGPKFLLMLFVVSASGPRPSKNGVVSRPMASDRTCSNWRAFQPGLHNPSELVVCMTMTSIRASPASLACAPYHHFPLVAHSFCFPGVCGGQLCGHCDGPGRPRQCCRRNSCSSQGGTARRRGGARRGGEGSTGGQAHC